MGCNQSDETNQMNTVRKPFLTMVGSTIKGPMILTFNQNSIQSHKCNIILPKYANALLKTNTIGVITGGIQQIQSSINQKVSIQDQIYQGIISKKFYQVNILKLLIQPDSAFQIMPQMINARYAHCSAILNGVLYVLGGRQYGDDQMGLLSAAEKYNSSDKKWQSIPPLRLPRSGAASLIYGQHIYVFGGYTGKNTRSRVIESYTDGDTGWRQVPFNLHHGLQGFVIIQNPSSPSSIFLFGGKTDFGKCNKIVQINFDTSSIRNCKSMKQKRSFHKIISYNKKIYIIGGGSDNIQIYDPKQQSTQINKQLSYLQHCSSKDLNSFNQFQNQIILQPTKKLYSSPMFKNKVYIFGHSMEPFSKIIDTDNLMIVSQKQNLKHNFYQFQTSIKVNKQNCFILGGINSDCTAVSNQAYSLNLQTQQIKYLQPMKIARYGFPAVVKGSFLYVIGGRKLGGDDVAILNQCQRFSFETYKWESIASLKYKRHSSLGIAFGNFLFAIAGYKGNGIRSNQIEVYIEDQNRWIQLQQKFQLAVQSMTSINYANSIYLFGGRAQQIDIQKVFKLHIQVDQGLKYEKGIKTELQPIGNLSKPGTNLRVFVNNKGIAYIFGNIQSGIDVYDLRNHQIQQTQKLAVFEQLADSLFQAYTIAF